MNLASKQSSKNNQASATLATNESSVSTDTICSSCLKPNAPFKCGLCENIMCKKCVQFVPENTFSFLKKIPPELLLGSYCTSCFEAQVAPALDTYNEAMARAGEVFVYYKAQSKETRTFRRSEEPIRVENCDDKDETLMRLAFYTAEAGFNALIDVVLSADKIRDGRYQTSRWNGVGIPTQMDPKRANLKYD